MALNLRRLMGELRNVQTNIGGATMPWLLRCEAIEDNLMEWEADISFPADSLLQQGLEKLATSTFDESRNRVTVQVRFLPEYPMVPPEVWLLRPRLKYGKAPVTFGGKLCNHLLSTSGWLPASSISQVFTELRTALVAAGAEVDMTVAVKRDYVGAPPQLGRLCTTLYPTTNDFQKIGQQAISVTEAGPFMGDLHRLEESDKVGLPFELAEEVYGRAANGLELDLPLMFEIKTQLGRKTHCAIYEFIQGLPSGTILLPKWVMDEMFIAERELVNIRCVKLDLITFVKVQPHCAEFYRAVQESGLEVNTLLTQSLSRFSALTEETSVPIEIGGQAFSLRIVALKPKGAVRIIDSDVRHHFEFEVDFDPAPDLEDEEAMKARQDKLVTDFKRQREKGAAERISVEERRAEAKRRRFEGLRTRAKTLSGDSSAGTEGDVEVSVRLPDSTQMHARFRDGVSVSCLRAYALNTDWANACSPWDVHLFASFPRRQLLDDETITKDLHRSAICVCEEALPSDFEALLDEALPEAPAQVVETPRVQLNEAELERRTRKAFEVQRFLQAGKTLVEATRLVEAGEVLPAGVHEVAPPHMPPVRRERSLPQPAAPPVRSAREQQVEDVCAFTGATPGSAAEMLELANWNTEHAITMLLDA